VLCVIEAARRDARLSWCPWVRERAGAGRAVINRGLIMVVTGAISDLGEGPFSMRLAIRDLGAPFPTPAT
jgi:hypothetical protein